MLALASLRYRDVRCETGGPIAQLKQGTISIRGRPMFQVCAWLNPGLLDWNESSGLYSSAAGTGTHVSLMVARFIAISEALERWAHCDISRRAGSAYGFDVDPTSSGMAAYPGFSTRQVRVKAHEEACERIALMSWWELGTATRRRETEWPGVVALEIAAPTGSVAVILYARTDFGHYVYGHAAATRFSAACRRAVVELVRHEVAIRRRWNQLQQGSVPPLRGLQERRSWYFSTPAGHARFLAAASANDQCARQPDMDTVFDGAIPGPWEKYAHVWRVACRMPSSRFLEEGEDYFFW